MGQRATHFCFSSDDADAEELQASALNVRSVIPFIWESFSKNIQRNYKRCKMQRASCSSCFSVLVLLVCSQQLWLSSSLARKGVHQSCLPLCLCAVSEINSGLISNELQIYSAAASHKFAWWGGGGAGRALCLRKHEKERTENELFRIRLHRPLLLNHDF